MTGIGVTAGGITGGAGAPLTGGLSVPALMAAGGVLGWAVGYIACPYLAPRAKKKLMSGQKLTHNETKNAIEAMHKYAGLNREEDAVRILAELRPSLVGMRADGQGNPSRSRLAGAVTNRKTS